MKKLALVCIFVLTLALVSCTQNSPQESTPATSSADIQEKVAPPVPLVSKEAPAPVIESAPSTPKETTTEETTVEPVSEEVSPSSEPAESPTKEFTMVAKQWEFQPSTITVNKNDHVRISITSTDVSHGFRLSEYGINEKIVPGETTIVDFVADKEGTFSFSCSIPCGQGHGGMSGKLVVK